MVSMLHQQSGIDNQHSRESYEKSEQALTADLTTLLKLRNRRMRPQGGGPLKNWPTANVDQYLKCQEYADKYPHSNGAVVACKIIETIRSLDYYEGLLARIEASDAL